MSAVEGADTLPRPSALRRWMAGAALTALSFGLLALFFEWSGITLGEAFGRLLVVPSWLILLFTASTLLQIALSAWKWQLVVHKLRPRECEEIGFDFYLRCTALATLLSQFLTVYLASALVRGWALRRRRGMAASFGASTSVYEQAFDFVILVVMALPAVIIWILGGTFAQWLFVTGATIAAGAGALRLVAVTRPLLVWLERRSANSPRLTGAFREIRAGGLLSPRFLLELYAISLVRYLAMLTRIPLLTFAMGLPLAMADTIPGFTLVQAMQVVAITPGQLGIREWTWSGVLALRGYDFALTAQFAIDLRIVGFLAMALAALPAVWGHQWRSNRR